MSAKNPRPLKHQPPPRAQARYSLEAQVVEGLKPFAEREIAKLLGRRVTLLPSEDPEAVPFLYEGELRRLLSLRTVVAVHLVLGFEVPRPKALLGHRHLRRLLEQLQLLVATADFASFRIGAAGRESAVFRRLAEEVATHTGLRHDPEEGDLLLRVRPAASGAGWEVLLRLSPRPLSARPWRVCNMAGGLNATVAAAMLDTVWARADDRFLNVMCGSGTLLVERLAQGSVRWLVGVDSSARALRCAGDNVRAAGVSEKVELLEADATALEFPGQSFNVIIADAPWGDQIGSHESNARLYPKLLKEASRLVTAEGHFVLLTHEIRLFERALREQAFWALRESHRVFHGGHYPRIYVLKRRG